MRTFMREEILPLEVLEAPAEVFSELIAGLQEQVRERGLWAAHLPPELGGQGFGQLKLALMHEILGATHWGPLVFGNQAPESGNTELIALAGTPEQKQQWMEPSLRGEMYSGFSMTEPGAGSDPTRLATTAVLDGDEWVINGHKWFTGHGYIADFVIVMAVTDPDAPPHQRASMFIVPKGAPGFDPARNIQNLHDVPNHPFGFGESEVFYRDCRVPKENLLGERGGGFKLAQARLGPGRIHHCMRWLGQARRAFDMLCERALQREVFDGQLADKQTVQNWIADSAAEMQAARLMTLHAAWRMDQFGVKQARTDISLIKFFGAKVLHDVVDRALQVHGALGYSDDLPLAMMYRRARAARIYDGPDEVHRRTVARQVLKGYQRNPGLWPAEHIPTRREAAEKKYAEVLAAHAQRASRA
ncbi:acyl-CoA dehydrogenase [Amycolatopsis sp. K13G38]|uniref:Acyl-CoA dehydrogenase n=2 Tax=Amycolatopsis acididurans TaxID=2724524 RepID=A0ABX1JCM5_9PSEU|nr:acyl-CoA dehydrogenase [Amycolatopsis acididurans]